jgi:hypothetical protein
VVNSLAYYGEDLIMTVKGFIEQAFVHVVKYLTTALGQKASVFDFGNLKSLVLKGSMDVTTYIGIRW